MLITFDDGYLDNYEIAYPILRSHGTQGVFFLATSMVGTCHVPWWDHIAYLMKTARSRRFSLRYPADLAVDIDGNGLTESLRAILRSYKRPDNADPARFIRELAEEAKGEEPPGTLRRFLNWDEAREMTRGGMAIGSHTHSHCVLSQLQPDQQYEELSKSRAILKEKVRRRCRCAGLSGWRQDQLHQSDTEVSARRWLSRSVFVLWRHKYTRKDIPLRCGQNRHR